MFVCRECASTFDGPHAVRDRWGNVLGAVCPECGSQDFTEASECFYCESIFPHDELIAGGLCPGCYDEIVGNRQDIVKSFVDIDREAFAEFVEDYMKKGGEFGDKRRSPRCDH